MKLDTKNQVDQTNGQTLKTKSSQTRQVNSPQSNPQIKSTHSGSQTTLNGKTVQSKKSSSTTPNATMEEMSGIDQTTQAVRVNDSQSKKNLDTNGQSSASARLSTQSGLQGQTTPQGVVKVKVQPSSDFTSISNDGKTKNSGLGYTTPTSATVQQSGQTSQNKNTLQTNSPILEELLIYKSLRLERDFNAHYTKNGSYTSKADKMVEVIQHLVGKINDAKIPFATHLLMAQDLSLVNDKVYRAHEFLNKGDQGDKSEIQPAKLIQDYERRIQQDDHLLEEYRVLLDIPNFQGLSPTFNINQVDDTRRTFISFMLFLLIKDGFIGDDMTFSPSLVNMSYFINEWYTVSSHDGFCHMIHRSISMEEKQADSRICYTNLNFVDRFEYNYQAVILNACFKHMLASYKLTSQAFFQCVIDFSIFHTDGSYNQKGGKRPLKFKPGKIHSRKL